MSERASDAGDFEDAALPSRRAAAVAGLASAGIAAAALAFFYSRGLTNLYGDGVAHVESARRLFDSLNPGYAQIGTVWLPLYHFLVAPLALNDTLWRTGLAGSFVSAAAFALSAWLMFLLGARLGRSTAAGVVAMAAFVLCPSMLFLASTPLTEPLALLWLVLVVYELARYGQSGRRWPLVAASLAAFCGTLTRYEIWFLLPFAALYVFWACQGEMRKRLLDSVIFSLLAGLGPVLWLAHNAYSYGNPLEFYNGPFSAQALYTHQVATTGFRYPTAGSYLLSSRYYLADLALLFGPWLLELAVLGLLVWVLEKRAHRRRAPALLLLVLFPFYVQAMAHAAIPLYLPTLFPYSYYNLRYGIEMLPALALVLSFLVPAGSTRRMRALVAGGLLLVMLAQAAWAFSKGASQLPIVQEGLLNNPCRKPRQRAVIDFLREHYRGGRILMALGKWSCVMPQTGIYIGQTVSQADPGIWKRLPQGAAKYVTWIVAVKGDPVDELMRAYPQAFTDFKPVLRQPLPRGESLTIYRRQTASRTIR